MITRIFALQRAVANAPYVEVFCHFLKIGIRT